MNNFKLRYMPWTKADVDKHKKGLTDKQKKRGFEKGTFHHTEKTKMKLSLNRKGKHLSEKTKMKIGKALKGRVHSEETKRKISEGQKGRDYSNRKSPIYKTRICPNCESEFQPTSGTQIYCGDCKFHCVVCGKEISKDQQYCKSCWQLGEKNNSKKLEARRKISKASAGNHYSFGYKHTEKTKHLHSIQMKGKNNPNFGKVTYGTGRCKWYDYFSSIAGDVKLQGTYELRMAKILDKLEWVWERPKDYFKYDNGNHAYIPDFKITKREDENCLFYIDTKGWFPKQEQTKIRKVREENNIILLLIDENTLNEYERRVG